MNRGAWTLACLTLTMGLISCQSSGSTGMDTPAPEPEAEQPAETTADAGGEMGLYTADQASRGEGVFQETCSFCHAPAQFSGTTFMRSWAGAPVQQLYQLISSTMPYDAPGSLSQQQYADVVAYILEINDLPAGDSELPADPSALGGMTIESE